MTVMADAGNGFTRIDHGVGLQRLRTALRSDDDVGVIIRCHYEVEQAARYTLNALSSGRSAAVNLRYLAQVLDALEIIGVSQNALAPSRCLNSYRNKIAHRGIDVIDEEFVREYHDLLKEVHTSFSETSFVLDDGMGAKIEKTFSEASYREKSVMITLQNLVLILAFAGAKKLHETGKL